MLTKGNSSRYLKILDSGIVNQRTSLLFIPERVKKELAFIFRI